MASSPMPPQVLGQRMQFSTLELGVGASLAAVAVLGVTLFAVAEDSGESTPNRDRDAPAAVVSQVP